MSCRPVAARRGRDDVGPAEPGPRAHAGDDPLQGRCPAWEPPGGPC
ncbi:hypothetical protein HMPREF0551_0601 [Lautropia mirabilis ATCC 51599]|uniref:Uncharacterized protein n=1 Tax=Lautropia mirabilis ATCC 51599 TaxID=887898 RepID=E7RV89_9BURK|nr:hypothetical protein HMPREF0551_0601 [Lautropia mirabilis ATCC 51599]